MKTLKKIFLLQIFFIYAVFQVALAKSEVTMTFEGNKYTIDYRINTTCSVEQSLDIMYSYSHLIKIALQAEKITLLEQGDNWYTVQYDYQYLIYQTRFIYKTTLDLEKGAIYFKMISFWRSSDFIPKPVEAYGYHKVIQGPGYTTIISTETCIFEKPVDVLKQIVMKHESSIYIANLEAYLKKMEEQN